jgi:hypothetical protein
MPHPAKILDTPSLVRLFETVKNDYDLIILDTAAVGDGGDVGLIFPYIDSLLLVLASNSVSAVTAKHALELIQTYYKSLCSHCIFSVISVVKFFVFIYGLSTSREANEILQPPHRGAAGAGRPGCRPHA